MRIVKRKSPEIISLEEFESSCGYNIIIALKDNRKPIHLLKEKDAWAYAWVTIDHSSMVWVNYPSKVAAMEEVIEGGWDVYVYKNMIEFAKIYDELSSRYKLIL